MINLSNKVYLLKNGKNLRHIKEDTHALSISIKPNIMINLSNKVKNE